MQKKQLTLSLFLCLLSSVAYCQKTYQLANQYLSRTLSDKGFLHTTEIVNKQTNTTLVPVECDEFVLRLSKGTDKVGTDFILRSKDFKVTDTKRYKLTGAKPGEGIRFSLFNAKHGLKVVVCYELLKDKPYLHKQLSITNNTAITLERIDVDALTLEDAYQPYTKTAITAQAPGNWSPGLGQPIYTITSGTFWGVEFPAANNSVTNQQMRLGYLWGRELKPGTTYHSYKSIMGAADDAAYIDDAFFDYINDIRIRPLRLQVQYNSWFDFGSQVTKELFQESVQYIHNKLVEERQVPPLNVYAIDDGWQDVTLPDLDKPNGVWSINRKFSPNFSDTHEQLKAIGSSLGLWLSPGCFFGSRPQVNVLRENGYEALSLSMSMAGPKYMDKLENRIIELTKQGVTYFKYDGLFGHLNTRDFELEGRNTPYMPQLNTQGFSCNDIRLNDKKYDELKMYYLVAGTERLMQLMINQHKVNPNVYTAITNGAYLSPWWLQYTDVVWLINCGDAAGGADRSSELVYRDGVYHEVFATENTKFPIHSIFNHEPKKTTTGESADEFRDYLFMDLSRGAAFVELYLKTKVLSNSDWDVLAEGLKWVRTVFPTFERVKMFGGNPLNQEVYGYSGWKGKQGYISLHNPSSRPQKIALPLNRQIGVHSSVKDYTLSSPLLGDTEGLKESWSYNDVLTLELKPKEIRILMFNK
ncbi:hypothetical protein [Bacteroides sp.]|uniref:hypothetical protein n=1 Tax=Bacteroides sp. TaxID=29523 RepID=UPI002FCB243F